MEVYNWARRHPGFVMAVKGRESIAAQQAIGSPNWQDVTVNGRKLKRGVRLWNIGTSMLKMELYGQLGLEKPVDGEDYPDGYIYLPDGLGDEWIKQLVAEELRFVKLRNGGVRREWHKVRDRNEALDNAIYARAVAIGIGVDRWTEQHWQKARGELDKPDAAPAKPAASTKQPPKAAPKRPPPPQRRNPFTSRRR
ncbi:phage terminase large subunit family protein [Sphingobium naphthae]|nr:phage terminase large subunit family protein [Sphingobium naphthae]